MRKLLFVYTERGEASAEAIRVKYFVESLAREGYSVLTYRVKASGFRKHLYYAIPAIPPSLKKLYEENEDLDLIASTVPPLLNALVSYRLAKSTGKPLVIDVRDIWEEYAKTSRRLLSSARLIDRVVGEFYEALKHARSITATTSGILKYYSERVGRSDMHVVPNGTDPDKISCASDALKDCDLVYLADFSSPYHAIEVILDVVEERGLRLLVVGGGKHLGRVKRLVRARGLSNLVEFAGSVPYDELSKYLCRAKVGVSGRPFVENPEYLYTMPVKIYDYLAAGLPIIAYGPPSSVVQEFIVENGVGFYVDRYDLSEMLKRVDSLVAEHREYYSKCTSLARSFDRKVLAREFVKVVERSMSKA